MRYVLIAWVFVGVIATSAASLVVAVLNRELSAIYVPLILLFEALCVVFLLLFLQEMPKEKYLGIESRWGGLGRGSSGWHISRPLIYLACTFVFAGAFAAAVANAIDVTAKHEGGKALPEPVKK